MKAKLKQLKNNFEKWSGFSLESDDLEGILNEIKRRSWDLQCEIDQQGKILEREAKNIFPNE